MRPVQYFSDEYLKQSRALSPTDIAHFLDDFQRINSPEDKTILISIRIPESLLNSFRAKCKLEQIPYQKKIKALMQNWLYPE